MNTERNNKIEEILNSLDGNPRALAPDFFYTRLKARMQKEQGGASNKSWVLRPAFALTAVVLVLIVNAAILLKKGEKESNNPLADSEKFQSIASEYSLNDNLVYDLNQEK
jgi:hypothetical protein